MKKIILITIILFLGITTFAQRYITKIGHIYFHSEAPLETIEAHNKQVNCAIDTKTGMFVFKVLMKSFVFEKALMQEHFNEDYVESDKYPNATFKGNIDNLKQIDFHTPGAYNANVNGVLTIHNVSKKIETKGVFIVKNENIEGKSKFAIQLKDYNINIPRIVAGKIAESLDIFVDVNLKPLK